MNQYIIKMGHVESVKDESDGLRIKVRLQQDGDTPIDDLPYAFPLLPKVFRSVPKEGECVLIFCSDINNKESNRYYIGPVISQDQNLFEDKYDYGRGQAISLLKGGELSPFERLSNYEETNGSFPKINDISILGRKSEDIILKDGEIDLRCGIRNKSNNVDDSDLLGNVIFNSQNPAYIQLKFQNAIGYSNKQEADSVINLVADKVNIISHKNKDEMNINLTDKNELIKSSDMDDIMKKLHQLPYGDLLVNALNIIRDAIV